MEPQWGARGRCKKRGTAIKGNTAAGREGKLGTEGCREVRAGDTGSKSRTRGGGKYRRKGGTKRIRPTHEVIKKRPQIWEENARAKRTHGGVGGQWKRPSTGAGRSTEKGIKPGIMHLRPVCWDHRGNGNIQEGNKIQKKAWGNN